MSQIPTLETERLVLRLFRLSDATDVQRLAGDPAVADTTLNVPHPYKDGMAEEWIAQHPARFADGKGVTFAIIQKSTGTLVGAISLMDISPLHQAELGYWMGTAYWRQGFCTEAGRAVLQYAFSALGLARINASHFTRNPASGRVLQKLGMRHEGSRPQHRKKRDRLEDVELYGILKDHWNCVNRDSQQTAGIIPGLRSNRETVGGLVCFGRMLDKIRLHTQGRLPSDYNRGHGVDGRLCSFLRVEYETVVTKAIEETDDMKVLEWCYATGRRPTEEDIFIFNAFLSKRGWQDDVSEWVRKQKENMGLSHRDDIQTAFDVYDADEGRK